MTVRANPGPHPGSGANTRAPAAATAERSFVPAAETSLAAAHARFGRAVMSVYVATAAVAIVLLVAALVTDLGDEKEAARQTLALETQVRSYYLARHLRLLADELTRLGLRSEVDLLDENMEPERSLLRLTHEKSAFFNVGVAILSPDGEVLWSEPQTFLAGGAPVSVDRLIATLKGTHAIQVAPGAVEREKTSVLYVASPILRGGRFTGALLGAIDLGEGGAIEQRAGSGREIVVALVTREGAVVYPPEPLPFGSDAIGKTVQTTEPGVQEARLGGRPMVIAGAPVHGTEFTLLSLAPADVLFGPARSRLVTRLASGLTIASVPLVLLVLFLRNSLRTFRQAEEDAVRDDRLRSLGEAVDLIAHEVKNSLNGIRLGLDLILQADRTGLETRHRQPVAGLRWEISRLSDFTTEMLSFSKGVVPRPVSIDLGELVRKVAELSGEAARSQSVQLDVARVEHPVRVRADPALLHVVVANLVGNALDFAAAGGAEEPRVVVRVEAEGSQARVRVMDNGPGVSKTVRPRLFEPFVTSKPNGVGVGLALSRRIARAHGGDIVLEESQPGAAFDLILPAEAS
jgi:signal transduction histidine kinase